MKVFINSNVDFCFKPEDGSGGSSPSGVSKSDANRTSSGGGGGGLMEEMNKLLAKRCVLRLQVSTSLSSAANYGTRCCHFQLGMGHFGAALQFDRSCIGVSCQHHLAFNMKV